MPAVQPSCCTGYPYGQRWDRRTVAQALPAQSTGFGGCVARLLAGKLSRFHSRPGKRSAMGATAGSLIDLRPANRPPTTSCQPSTRAQRWTRQRWRIYAEALTAGAGILKTPLRNSRLKTLFSRFGPVTAGCAAALDIAGHCAATVLAHVWLWQIKRQGARWPWWYAAPPVTVSNTGCCSATASYCRGSDPPDPYLAGQGRCRPGRQ